MARDQDNRISISDKKPKSMIAIESREQDGAMPVTVEATTNEEINARDAMRAGV